MRTHTGTQFVLFLPVLCVCSRMYKEVTWLVVLESGKPAVGRPSVARVWVRGLNWAVGADTDAPEEASVFLEVCWHRVL